MQAKDQRERLKTAVEEEEEAHAAFKAFTSEKMEAEQIKCYRAEKRSTRAKELLDAMQFSTRAAQTQSKLHNIVSQELNMRNQLQAAAQTLRGVLKDGQCTHLEASVQPVEANGSPPPGSFCIMDRWLHWIRAAAMLIVTMRLLQPHLRESVWDVVCMEHGCLLLQLILKDALDY
jgi:hypothetical protein